MQAEGTLTRSLARLDLSRPGRGKHTARQIFRSSRYTALTASAKSVANGTYLETFHRDRDPMFYALVANRSKFDNGYYAVPQGPGFGLELDRDVMRKYAA